MANLKRIWRDQRLTKPAAVPSPSRKPPSACRQSPPLDGGGPCFTFQAQIHDRLYSQPQLGHGAPDLHETIAAAVEEHEPAATPPPPNVKPAIAIESATAPNSYVEICLLKLWSG